MNINGPMKSLSARRAWIEIIGLTYDGLIASVALRKESVDRNCPGTNTILFTTVALRKESVDRNTTALAVLSMYSWSLSARRAWIEISTQCRL